MLLRVSLLSFWLLYCWLLLYWVECCYVDYNAVMKLAWEIYGLRNIIICRQVRKKVKRMCRSVYWKCKNWQRLFAALEYLVLLLKWKIILRCQRNRAQVLLEHLSLKLRLHKYCLGKNFKPVYLGRRWLLRQRLKTIFIFVDSWTKSARRFVTGKHY